MEERLIKLDFIQDNPYQPRTVDDLEHIEKLARSIASDGLLQKPQARNHQANDAIQLAFGHSRRKAFEWLRTNYQEQGLTDRYDGYTCMPLEIVQLSDEEMYRFAVTENVQRKDLAPTEVARSMKRYMDEFKANSQMVAALFGVNDATVRGMIRYLDLPEPVQQKLDDGTITQGTARTLLSMQKIASPAVIVETVNKIEKRQGDELPEVTIERVVQHQLHDVVSMWDEDSESGKAHSSRHGGWPLDMKRFPNTLLPKLTPVDIALALGIEDDQEKIANANTWCLMNTGELDPEAEGAAGFDLTPDGLGLSTVHVALLEHLINPPACSACPFYTKIHGTHFCGVKPCHTRKMSAWHIHLIQNASKNLGIAIYDHAADGSARALDSEDVKLFKNRHKGLRLMPREQWNGGYVYQYSYEGVDTSVFIVVAIGDAKDKLACSRGNAVGGKKTEKEKIEMRKMKIYRIRRKELLWEFAGIAKSIFKGVPAAAVDEVQGWKFVGIDDRIPSEWEPGKDASEKEKTEFQKRELVWKMIFDECSHYRREPMADILEGLQEKAEEWGVNVPDSLVEKAKQWDAEIDAVSTETKKIKK